MGVLEFFASIIGSLAWPGVVLVVLWYNRHRLANLPDWIEELTLPGGFKIKFEKALNEATKRAELLAPKVQDAHAKDDIGDPLADLAKQFPEIAVIESFREIDRTLWTIAYRLFFFPHKNFPERALAELVRLDYIDENTAQLFKNLRDARDAALRTVQNNSPRATSLRLQPEQALRYRDASRTLNMKLREVLTSLERDNRQKIP